MKDFEFLFSNNILKKLNTNYLNILNKYALVLLKPECLALNMVEKVFDEFELLGFYPVYIKFKILSQNQVFSLWKYGWENADLTRIILNCFSICWNYSAIVILKNSDQKCNDSCKELNGYKKSSLNPIQYSIRKNIGAINNYLNFIHVSDNTNEMIREIPILLNLDEIIKLIEEIQYLSPISVEEIKKINPVLENYSIDSLSDCVNNYIDSLNKVDFDKSIKDELIKSVVTKRISSKTFLNLFFEGKIPLTWNNILLFTQITDFKE